MKPWRPKLRTLSLSSRLLLAFTIVAALPLTVVPLVIRAVTDSYDSASARELDDAAHLVQSELDRLTTEVMDRTKAVAAGSLTADVADYSEGGDPAALIGLAAPALAESGLDVLEIVDEQGRILLCGHLPARLGDQDEAAVTLLKSRPTKPLLATVEVKDGDEIRQATALVFALPAPLPHGGAIYGGKLFDQEALHRLENLARGEVSLRTTGSTEVHTVLTTSQRARRWLGRFFAPTRRVIDVPMHAVDGTRFLRVRLSSDALSQAKWRIASGAIIAFALALAVGIAAAAWLSRRTVGPIEALVEATQELAKGDLKHRVDVKATGELQLLVDAFNQMTGELGRAQERLAQAERVAAWEQIARALAHEIKNPLTPIAMAIETLQRAYDKGHPDFERFLKEGTATVLEEVGRLKRLATEFGEFARWPKPVTSPATPGEILRSAAALYGSLPEKHSLSVEVEDALPAVNVDRDQLQRALVNLVKNALEAMPDGGHVVLRARRLDDGIALEAADNGPGIAPETRQRLFEPYFTTKLEGTGLGLAIVHRIVTEHGGRLTVDETHGGGATFRLWLPLAAPQASAA